MLVGSMLSSVGTCGLGVLVMASLVQYVVWVC